MVGLQHARGYIDGMSLWSLHVVGYNNSDNHTFPVSGEAVYLDPLVYNSPLIFPEYAQ
jgi:hypothetical protein